MVGGEHGLSGAELSAYLDDTRALVLVELRRIIPAGSPYAGVLYDLMMEYPLRAAKTLRPAIAVATCRALGGRLEPVLPTAAVLELYHNAFLIHDDVEDRSEKRRDQPTLHEAWGVPIAVNVGDAMLALALGPLLGNMRLLGMGKALRILQAVAEMARESAEGQAIELSWVRDGRFDLEDADYERMVEKKTSYYSFVTPVTVGAIAADAPAERVEALVRFARLLGVAFQIQDDVLNLDADEGRYGKEIGGDLWEGKHTLILLHALRRASAAERERARAVLARQRPSRERARLAEGVARVERALAEAARGGGVTEAAEATLRRELGALAVTSAGEEKTADDVAFLFDLIRRERSLDHARAVAVARARAAAAALDEMDPWLRPSVHRSFLRGLVDYVVVRDR